MINVALSKSLGDFKLNIYFQSNSRRIGILGESGSGKSLTLKMLAGIERADKGSFILDSDIIIKDKFSVKPQKRDVGYLFQGYALFPRLTVEQNISVALKNKETAYEMIDKFRLKGLEKLYPSQLSGGQQQRTALARLMAQKPKMILLDEPFSALDTFLKEELILELNELLADYDGTVITVSHSIRELYALSDELVVIDKGSVAEKGKTKEIFELPQCGVTARLVGIRNISFNPIEDWGIAMGNPAAIKNDAFNFNEGIALKFINPVAAREIDGYAISFMPFEGAIKPITFKLSVSEWESISKNMPSLIYINKGGIITLKSNIY